MRITCDMLNVGVHLKDAGYLKVPEYPRNAELDVFDTPQHNSFTVFDVVATIKIVGYQPHI